MSARSGLVGKNPPGPIWGHLGPFFAWAGKMTKNQKISIFCIFRPTQKIGPDGPKWGQEDFFQLIQTLPTFWAERILILRFFIFF